MNEVLIENQELTEKAHPIMGFLEIIMQPYELGRKIIPRWFQIVAIAVLLETFCMTTGMYLVSKSDGVKSEMAAMNSNIIKRLEKNPQITDEQLEEMKEQFDSNFEFKPLSTVGVSLIYSLFGIFVVGAFFFFAARLIRVLLPGNAITKIKVNDELKKMITFHIMNLSNSSYPFSTHQFDVIFCRNVLIYFSRDLQDRAMDLFARSLVFKGYLGIGSKETVRLSSSSPFFDSVNHSQNIYFLNAL